MATISKAMQSLLLVSLLLFAFSGPFAAGNLDGDALIALKSSLKDPDGVLQSWDPTLVDPCTWFHVTCDDNNRVTRLDLGLNNLGGSLVPDLGKLDNLQYLELYQNNIEGTIPTELGNLKSLISFDLYNNELTGSIPSSLGNLKSLTFLRLNDNKLTGSIPQEIADIPTLRVLDLSTNDLSGAVPGPIAHIGFTNFSNNPRLGHPPVRVVPKLHGI